MTETREVHAAARGFASVAGEYERARPSYPPEAVAFLAERLGLRPGRRVLDLAAGTGKLTRLLAGAGASVVAVEPLAELRRELLAAAPEVEALDGVAERIPLPDASVDAATVAQAFHWFRPGEALAELARVLRPGGTLALVWNVRDERDPLQRELSGLIEPLRGTAPRGDEHRPPSELVSCGLFGPVEEARFAYAQQLDRPSFVERYASISVVASAPPERRRALLERIAALAETLPEPITIPYETRVYAADAAVPGR